MQKLQSLFRTNTEMVDIMKENDYEYIAKFHYPGKLKTDDFIEFDGTEAAIPQKVQLSLTDFTADDFRPVCSYNDVINSIFHLYFSEILDSHQDICGLVLVNGQSLPITIKNNQWTVIITAQEDIVMKVSPGSKLMRDVYM